MHEYPLSYVDHVATREVFASMQPTFKMPSRNTIKKDILEMYEVEKLNINKMMDANDSRVAITTDIFTYVPAPHSNEVLSNALMKVLLEWNLDRKLSTITLDNCSTNDAMIDVLLGLKESVEKIRNSVVYWTSTSKRHETFRCLCSTKQKDSNYKSVPSNEEWELQKKFVHGMYDERNFDKYWEEIHGIMGVAAILDPRYKLDGLEYKFARVNADEDDDVGYQLYIRQKKKEKGSFVKTEFDHYVEEDVHPLIPDFDILAWWKHKCRIIATHRGSLHEDTVEALIAIKIGGKPDYQTANEDDDAFSELTEE
ncbi:zinc finger BED domain-containing protein DAYSLEEPER-like [Arachis stenosperma]|uniref:zinc finger BED domain-containing protein DAYSLEEPER-like n=1 Tax=Arachis stenosperma TaxID=217475 RepID=UPI0025AD123D|nr:zinc finger BED domain-containing protein DAYSLEEPER-like [Arachis stenosperma]